MVEPNIEQPLSPWNRLLVKVRRRFGPRAQNASEVRLRRRRAMVSFLTRRLAFLKLALLFAGYIWMLIIPSPRLGRRTYIDENALQPGQVNTYWNWGEVHAADQYLEKLEALRDANATSEQRALFIATEFRRLGISASTQNYMFSANTGRVSGTNAYGILASPRTSGSEALVISASWLSRTGEGDGTLNLRGVATVLALAGSLKRYSLWAKDIVFVVSDGYLEGMHAWLAAYHGSSQSNLLSDPLTLSSGVIWTALNIDYPGHSFSHLGIFFEGLNGRLPNQDLLNAFQRIARYQVPVVLYDHLEVHDQPDSSVLPWFIPSILRKDSEVQTYAYQARNVIRHVGYQARGRPSGVHGLYHQFRIDAFTLFAVPATGPHGFHAIGRIIESTLRTMNNLLERLHASFFFYILTGPERFLKIGHYLPSAVLISVAMMFSGLRAWVDAGWTASSVVTEKKTHRARWSRRRRPILRALSIMLMTHVLGALLFGLITTSWFVQYKQILSPLVYMAFALIPLTALFIPFAASQQNVSSLSLVLKAINLCFASTVISTTTVLNFSLAATLAVLLGIPLSIPSNSGPLPIRLAKYAGYTLLGLGWLLVGQEELLKAIWDWEILSAWFAPFVCFVYVPLVVQAGLVCLLPP
ncbi:putative gpi-anchor transamidase [Lyophyllum shimeji]|uniref:Gpi-anchor transamidase n=1 Tax=Lyophyllum shimeji TaxID=47721 RepID=A0A9P3UKS5_LYOSH|nr:putative gpi-anchor transamidase [Lyophyllum shimeji]